MARFYKYKSADELTADAHQLGLDVTTEPTVSALFQPVAVGHRTAGNRFCIQPMEGCDGTLEGNPDELTYRRYRRFGDGGAKLIWGEATAICDEGRMNPRQLWLHEQNTHLFENMLQQCRAAHREAGENDRDLLVGLQLTHSGRYSCRSPKLAVRCPNLDSITIDRSTKQPIGKDWPVLTDDDLKRIEDLYVDAAKLAWKVGCDFIDLKQCHRYLLSELLGAETRTGPYGGSLENRTRLVRNVITRVREDVPELIIASRFNVFDGIPFRKRTEDQLGEATAVQIPVETSFGTNENEPSRMDLSEPIQLAKWLSNWGVTLLNVTLGNPYANPHYVRPAEFPPVDGYLAPEHPLIGVARHFDATTVIQNTIPDVPVVGSGYSWLQEYALEAGASNVKRGRCAFVGMGRATLSHPDFVRHVRENGQLNRKLVCRTFSYCTNLMRSKDHPLGQYATGCPPFDKDVYGPLWKKLKPNGRERSLEVPTKPLVRAPEPWK